MYGDYCFSIPPLKRILDLGAYCGYVAVYLANRFPDAKIMCVEPPSANFDALLVNTSAYANIIRCMAAAVWPERTTLEWSEPVLGDWGNRFAPGSPATDNAIPAFTISDILEMRGWDSADFIKCIGLEAQVESLTHPYRPWAERAILVATKPPKGVWPNPDDESRLLDAFPDDIFERVRNGNMILGFRRRTPAELFRPAARQPMSLVPTSPRLRPIWLANVEDRFGFYRFGRAGLNLLLNRPGTLPASVSWRLDLDHHLEFLARISSGSSTLPSAKMSIMLTVRDATTGATCVDKGLLLGHSTDQPWTVQFEPLSGTHDVTLSAQPALDAGNEHIPWIRIVDARFV
jgi:FkbM family methyltransferase